jgi:hypothetical protein
MRAVCENIACLKRLKKQKKFFKSKGKDMVCCKETERATTKAAAMPSNVLALSLTEADPFVGVEVPLLPPEVWA